MPLEYKGSYSIIGCHIGLLYHNVSLGIILLQCSQMGKMVPYCSNVAILLQYAIFLQWRQMDDHGMMLDIVIYNLMEEGCHVLGCSRDAMMMLEGLAKGC